VQRLEVIQYRGDETGVHLLTAAGLLRDQVAVGGATIHQRQSMLQLEEFTMNNNRLETLKSKGTP